MAFNFKVRHTLPKDTPLTQEHLAEGLRSRIEFSQTWADRVADLLTESFGTLWFFILNALLFLFWILANTGHLGFAPFDPYPFNFLTMVVSLEAIFLAIIVLMSQNRASRIADIRQKMDFEVNVRAEEEITKIISILHKLHDHVVVKNLRDPELREMEKKMDLKEIQRAAEH
jgi:uncharacterized membrane protein